MKYVLVVDNEPMITSVIQQYLNSHGYIAIAANDGAKALEISQKILIHFLITEYRLKDMNGVELLGRMRTTHPRLPVIFISAYAAEIQMYIDTKTAILQKPFQFEKMVTLMEKMMCDADTARTLEGP